MNKWLTGEWAVQRTSAKTRRMLHYWATALWLTAGTVIWIVLRDVLWFVGFMSLYAIWITHLAGWAAETPVEDEVSDAQDGRHRCRPRCPPPGRERRSHAVREARLDGGLRRRQSPRAPSRRRGARRPSGGPRQACHAIPGRLRLREALAELVPPAITVLRQHLERGGPDAWKPALRILEHSIGRPPEAPALPVIPDTGEGWEKLTDTSSLSSPERRWTRRRVWRRSR